ncbi:Hydrocephalus-inducing protein-like protein [Camelus dromedarius]|uniref:Hydrocephalus-inducing protein-like protein n=1 Tax=Camelus dromedarius TaxID=9838 RepID=A0A5N4DT58_CAMDR|nr:Hydrocephalus-inducing protein-like protein [Camelus dromedarius]
MATMGFISSHQEQVLKVYYLPGVPEVFQRSFQIQIAHLDPENITLSGEGIFPRICLDLPRNLKGNEKYEIFLNQARKNLEKECNKYEMFDHSETPEEVPEDESSEMEIERLIVQGYAIEHQKSIIPYSVDDFCHRSRWKLTKVQLPEYILDFGYIILGDVRTHIIKITNTSHFPVSFHAEKRVLHGTGFSIELDRVKNLPYCETETFELRFDPQGASLSVGNKEVVLPIKVVGGPTVHIRLQAKVTIPTMTLSSAKVEFATIQCGQCLVETVQLSNHLQVPCEWFIHSHKKVSKLEKHMPKYLRRKLCAELKPKTRIFEIQPTSGVLDPGERSNVQVKFMPKEEKFYSQTLVFQIAQSTQKLTLLAQGQGLEPHLEFSPSVLKLGPLLPYAPGDEAEVVVKNPCNFPIEFYSLEFDQQYLVEEKILRTLKGYDSYNTLLLPPRLPGEKLPPEVYEYFKEVKRIKEEQMKMKYLESLAQENEEDDGPSSEQGTSASTKRTSLSQGISVTSNLEERHIPVVESKTYPDEEEDEESLEKIMFQTEKIQSIESHSAEEVGEVENNPVSKAIARHLGIDISAEARLAKNRKGIAIIVHGTPLSGKSATAVSLAKYYSAACLNIDSIVLEAISNSNNIEGIRARELCIRAAIEQSMKEEESGGIGEMDISEKFAEVNGAEVKFLVREEARMSWMQQVNGGLVGQVDVRALDRISSSPLLSGPAQRRLSVSGSIGGDTGLVSCVLPEELFTQILAKRIQLSDCYRGVVFDSLDTLFARNAATTLLCLLKAIGNREHIYVLNMAQDFTAMKAQEKAKKEQEGKAPTLRGCPSQAPIACFGYQLNCWRTLQPKLVSDFSLPSCLLLHPEHKRKEALEREKERLQNMDEEEYDALTEEEKIIFNQEVQQALQERKRRELERLAREMHEKKLQQELERQKEDELKRKIKKPKQGLLKEEPAMRKPQIPSRQTHTFSKLEVKSDTIEREVSVREQAVVEKEELNKKRRNLLADSNTLGFPLAQEQEDSEGDLPKDTENQMAQKFKTYELTFKDIQNILMYWDRKQGVQQPHAGAEDLGHDGDGTDQRQVPSGGRRGRKDRERERAERERLERERAERERLEKLRALEERSDTGEGEEEDHEGKKDLGVPFINIQTPNFEGLSWKQVLESDKLPRADQILDLLGLGSSGLPIPPPALFSIVSYPVKRLPLATTEILKHFVFVTPPSEELSLMEEKKEAEADGDVSTTTGSSKVKKADPVLILIKGQEEQTTSSKSSKQKLKEKMDQTRETQKEKRRMAFNRKGPSGGTSRTIAPLLDIEQNNFSGQHSQEKFIRLNHFRWIVPANSEVTLRVHFSSNDLNIFDQTFNFEILGTRRQYQLYCRGVCTYPYICQDPKVVFPQWKMDMNPNEVIFKKYIVSMERFYFGPLLCGKSRDKYKSSLFPGNMETLTILNSSPMVVEVFFCFQNDVKANTYFLEPITMVLKPNEQQMLNVWAYPTAVGVFEDSIVCCIKENPEPAVFKLSCQGVRPELELDPKQLHFDRLLLHRKESKVVLLRNVTLLPVAWRITSLEHLGEDFTVSVMQGIIPSKAEQSLQVHFQPSKAINIKKAIRLEVLDVDSLVGVVQIENILVFAESYDVALDITFPKDVPCELQQKVPLVVTPMRTHPSPPRPLASAGAEGGLDFGIVRVLEEVKQPLQLKNRGKYEIMFR